MKRVASRAGWRVAGVLAMWGVTAAAQGERTPSIMALMHKQYDVSRAPFVVVRKELASETPDWDKVQAATRSFATLAAALKKNTPRRGDQASWAKLTDLHLADARALDEAAAARDREGARAIHRRLAASCKACHDAHRFRGDDPR